MTSDVGGRRIEFGRRCTVGVKKDKAERRGTRGERKRR